jgi:hypothetical protein
MLLYLAATLCLIVAHKLLVTPCLEVHKHGHGSLPTALLLLVLLLMLCSAAAADAAAIQPRRKYSTSAYLRYAAVFARQRC